MRNVHCVLLNLSGEINYFLEILPQLIDNFSNCIETAKKDHKRFTLFSKKTNIQTDLKILSRSISQWMIKSFTLIYIHLNINSPITCISLHVTRAFPYIYACTGGRMLTNIICLHPSIMLTDSCCDQCSNENVKILFFHTSKFYFGSNMNSQL